MSWKVRHEGSPKHIDGLTPDQIVQGLLDAQFEPTDEVQGPNESAWTALESHPQFAEIAADIEPPPPRVYDDETRLDMTALIDVCMVLLIFFILTTVYASQELLLEAAGGASDKPGAIRVVDQEKADDTMAFLTMEKPADRDVIVLEVVTKKPGLKPFTLEIKRSDVFDKEQRTRFKERLKEGLAPLADAGLRTLMIEFKTAGIPHDLAVTVQDGARAVKMTEVLYKVP